MRRLKLTLLMAAVLASGVATVYTRHQGRATFVALQKLEETRDALNVEWGRLQLEQATWAQSGRVEEKARQELGLVSRRVAAGKGTLRPRTPISPSRASASRSSRSRRSARTPTCRRPRSPPRSSTSRSWTGGA